jgi:hypothetical protein
MSIGGSSWTFAPARLAGVCIDLLYAGGIIRRGGPKHGVYADHD